MGTLLLLYLQLSTQRQRGYITWLRPHTVVQGCPGTAFGEAPELGPNTCCSSRPLTQRADPNSSSRRGRPRQAERAQRRIVSKGQLLIGSSCEDLECAT